MDKRKFGGQTSISQTNCFITKFELAKNLSNMIKKNFARPIFDHKNESGVQEVKSDYSH